MGYRIIRGVSTPRMAVSGETENSSGNLKNVQESGDFGNFQGDTK